MDVISSKPSPILDLYVTQIYTSNLKSLTTTDILALGSTLAGVADAAAIPASDIAQRDANAAPVIAREARAQPWKRFIDVNERDAAVEVREAEADVKLGPIRVKRGEDFSSGLGGQ